MRGGLEAVVRLAPPPPKIMMIKKGNTIKFKNGTKKNPSLVTYMAQHDLDVNKEYRVTSIETCHSYPDFCKTFPGDPVCPGRIGLGTKGPMCFSFRNPQDEWELAFKIVGQEPTTLDEILGL